jgi:hypothetical protein
LSLLKGRPGPSRLLALPVQDVQILDVDTEQTPGDAHGVFTVETVDE